MEIKMKRNGKKQKSPPDEKVDRLLHDAEHALSGSKFARSVGDRIAEKELRDKHRLVAEAQAADPGHGAPAWAEHREWLKR